jgi:hypothetical protein
MSLNKIFKFLNLFLCYLMIFEDKSLITLVGLIVLLILFLNMTQEKFQNSSSNLIKIINDNIDSDIPSIIKNPKGNFLDNGSDFVYDAKEETLTGTYKDRDGNNFKPKYDFKLNPCVYLNYDDRKEKFDCRSSE